MAASPMWGANSFCFPSPFIPELLPPTVLSATVGSVVAHALLQRDISKSKNSSGRN